VMYCVEVLMHEYTHNLNEKKKLCEFYKFKRHAIHKPGGGGVETY
jgi:hypothetical protein